MYPATGTRGLHDLLGDRAFVCGVLGPSLCSFPTWPPILGKYDIMAPLILEEEAYPNTRGADTVQRRSVKTRSRAKMKQLSFLSASFQLFSFVKTKYEATTGRHSNSSYTLTRHIPKLLLSAQGSDHWVSGQDPATRTFRGQSPIVRQQFIKSYVNHKETAGQLNHA